MQHDAADELHRVGLHAQHTPGRFPNGSKGLHQNIVQGFALGKTLFEFGGFCLQGIFGKGIIRPFQRHDFIHQRPDLFDLPLGVGSEHFCQQSHNCSPS